MKEESGKGGAKANRYSVDPGEEGCSAEESGGGEKSADSNQAGG